MKRCPDLDMSVHCHPMENSLCSRVSDHPSPERFLKLSVHSQQGSDTQYIDVISDCCFSMLFAGEVAPVALNRIGN